MLAKRFLTAVAVLGWLVPADPGFGQASTVTVTVDAALARHPIDPRIYGVSRAGAADLSALNSPVNRWGGNNATRYNWRANADNRAGDWYFESIPYASAAEGAEADAFISGTRDAGAAPMITIPLIPWVARLGTNRGKLASFSIAKYGPQTGNDWQWFPDAGNGISAATGQPITGNDPADASALVDAGHQTDWVRHLVTQWGGAGSGGVRHYVLDNEPSIWWVTHRDVMPIGVDMEEMRDRIIAHAAAIKSVDPAALVLGPEEWGWDGYRLSGYDSWYRQNYGCCTLPDRETHGDMDYVPWLLEQMRLHEQQTEQRLLDVLTVHYYPQGGEFGNDVSSAMQARRNRSTRSLWDPNYVDESWINDRVQLVPRLKSWAGTHYPGTKVGLTEYNWGAENHINGATTQADILGILGREGADMATRWVVPAAGSPTFKAFQMYRNYDGNKSTFGDVSVSAAAPDPDQLSAFAAERQADGALTLMLVNKATAAASTTVEIRSFSPAAAAPVYQLRSTNTIARLADAAVSGGRATLSLPAQSITLLVVPRATGGGTPALSVGEVIVSEGDTGTTAAQFTVSLSAPASTIVSVAYATGNGTAVAGSDYIAGSGTLTFAPGETIGTVPINVLGDTAVEGDETFTLGLSQPQGATIANPSATATIRNDDSALPSIVSPPPGSQLPGRNVVFSWSAGTGVDRYGLMVGRTLGASDYANWEGTTTRLRVKNLPRDGSTVYVRLRWRSGGAWAFTDYTYTASP